MRAPFLDRYRRRPRAERRPSVPLTSGTQRITDKPAPPDGWRMRDPWRPWAR